MTRTVLHPAFVEVLRLAWEQEPFRRRPLLSRSLSGLCGSLYWSTEDGRTYPPQRRDLKRIARLAAVLGYDGPITMEVTP